MSDWDRAFHAYGPARGGDALLDVLRDGAEERYVQEHPEGVWQPYSFLWSALYCGGRITPATVAGLRHLMRTVVADDFGGADPTLREAVSWWIRDVVRAALAVTDLDDMRRTAARRHDPAVTAWLDEYLGHERSILDWDDRDEPGQVLIAAARVDCFDLLPGFCPPLSSLLVADQPDEVRAAAASAVASLTGHPAVRRHRDEIAAYHVAQARQGPAHHRASMVLGLGELGEPTREWLTDPELAVRVCAALAPGLAADATAAEVLRSAADDPASLDRSLGGRWLHQLAGHHRAVADALRTRSGW